MTDNSTAVERPQNMWLFGRLKTRAGYQIYINERIKRSGDWTEFKAKVLSMNKTSPSHKPKRTVILTSPTACPCPYIYALKKEPLYILTKGAEKMVNKKGNNVFRYLLDEKSIFLSVASPLSKKSPNPKLKVVKVPHYAMADAFNSQKQCKKR